MNTVSPNNVTMGQDLSEVPGPRLGLRGVRRGLVMTGLHALAWTGPYLARIGPLRRAVVGATEQRLVGMYNRALALAIRPPGVESDRLAMSKAILHTIERALAENRLSRATLRKALNILIGQVLIGQGDWNAKDRFNARYGSYPPDLLLISPTKACNLRCVGCYADSGPTREKLPWPVFERLVREAHDLWGARFCVISGGEPLAYHDQGKGVLDIAERYPDIFFLMYTNGTLIDDKVARRLATLGNLTPAISVEGLREPTDARRGKGVFERIIAAMELLRREKVLFGISITATRQNADEILSDTVVDFYFRQMGVFYAWIFHYMPIGRAFTLELMPTPQQRVHMWRRMWELVRGQQLFIADFWNSGTVSSGCISAGRSGGYLCVDWNGAVTPCVFAPYSPVNIHTAYQQGQTLNDVWNNPFFREIRAWQHAYGYGRTAADGRPWGNWLMPCPIRDHYAEFHRLLVAHEPDPADENARAAFQDPEYYRGMVAFDQEMASLADQIWEAKYVNGGESTVHDQR